MSRQRAAAAAAAAADTAGCGGGGGEPSMAIEPRRGCARGLRLPAVRIMDVRLRMARQPDRSLRVEERVGLGFSLPGGSSQWPAAFTKALAAQNVANCGCCAPPVLLAWQHALQGSLNPAPTVSLVTISILSSIQRLQEHLSALRQHDRPLHRPPWLRLEPALRPHEASCVPPGPDAALQRVRQGGARVSARGAHPTLPSVWYWRPPARSSRSSLAQLQRSSAGGQPVAGELTRLSTALPSP